MPLRRELDDRFANAQKWISAREYCPVRIETADGAVGWGECWGPIAGTSEVLDERIAPLLRGREAAAVESIHEDLVFDLRSAYHSTVSTGAVSGVDLALCDLRGKAAGIPVATLLGGKRRESVPAYATGHFWPPGDEFTAVKESVVSEARSHVEAGFDALKFKIGLERHFGWGPEYGLELVRAVREAVGDDVAVMADANHAYDLPTARRVADGPAEVDAAFFEEPLALDRIDAWARLNRESPVPIAGGECRAFAPEFRRVTNAGAAECSSPT